MFRGWRKAFLNSCADEIGYPGRVVCRKCLGDGRLHVGDTSPCPHCCGEGQLWGRADNIAQGALTAHQLRDRVLKQTGDHGMRATLVNWWVPKTRIE